MEKKLLFVVVLMTILFASLITSTNVDKVGTYKNLDKTFVVKDNFGVGKVVGEATLTSHKTVDEVLQVEAGNNVKVMQYKIKGNLDLGKVDFKNMKTGQSLNKNYHFVKVDYITKQVPVVKTICTNQKDESTCHEQIIRYDTVTEERRTNYNLPFTQDGMTLELWTDVKAGDYVDGIFSFDGIKADRHARWNSTLNEGLQAVYDFNETSGSLIEKSRGILNLSVTGSPYYSINTPYLPNAIDTRGSSAYFKDTSATTVIPPKNGTAIIWIQPYDSQSEEGHWWGSGNGDYRLATSLVGIQFTIGGTNVVLDNTIPYFERYGINMMTVTWDTDADIYRIYYNETLLKTSTTPASDSASNGLTFFALSSGARPVNANITDFKVFNRTLTQSEISVQYNTGLGIPYSNDYQYLINSLNSPSTNTTFIAGSTLSFSMNANINPLSNINLTNTTLRIWNETNYLVLTNTTEFNGTSNLTTLTAVLNNKGYYQWNYYTCSRNSSSIFCGEATANRTFDVQALTIINESYNNVTLSGSQEFFEINLSSYGTYTVQSANLIYNGSVYGGNVINTGGTNYTISRTLAVPSVPASINKTWYWSIELNNGLEENTTIRNQTVSVLTIDNCTVNTFRIYNFTIRDEDSQSILNPTADKTFAKIDMQLYNSLNGSFVSNYSANVSQINSMYICFNVNITGTLTYKIDTLVQFGALNHSTEFYNIQNSTLSSTTNDQQIQLYSLSNLSSTEFKLTFKDTNFNPVQDALVVLQRKYIDEGKYKTVEIPKTDSNGQSLLHLRLSDTYYNLIIIKNNQVIATFYDYIAKCQSTVLSTCEINLNQLQSSILPKDYTTIGDFTFLMNWNYTTRRSSVNFIIPSISSSTILLNVTSFTFNNNDTQLCSDSQYLSAGTIYCDVPTWFNGTAIARVYKDGVLMGEQVINNIGSRTNKQTFGNNIVFLTLIFLLTFIGLAISDNPVIMGMILILGIIVATALNLISGTSFLGAGATIIWIIVAIVLIIIKGVKR